MPEEFLDCPDIVAIFEKVGSEAVAEGVRCNGFIHFGAFGGLPDCPLEVCLIEMMALFSPADRINREIGRRENVLPGEFTVRIGVFAC
jgi:hypothetical protein